MNDLLENLKNFLQAGDESRVYALSRGEVLLVVDEIERLRGTQVRLLTFDEVREEARRRKRHRAAEIAERIDAEVKQFPGK